MEDWWKLIAITAPASIVWYLAKRWWHGLPKSWGERITGLGVLIYGLWLAFVIVSYGIRLEVDNLGWTGLIAPAVALIGVAIHAVEIRKHENRINSTFRELTTATKKRTKALLKELTAIREEESG